MSPADIEALKPALKKMHAKLLSVYGAANALALMGDSKRIPDDSLTWMSHHVSRDVNQASYAWVELLEALGFEEADPLFEATRENDGVLRS